MKDAAAETALSLEQSVCTIKLLLAAKKFPTNKQLIEICAGYGASLIGDGRDPHLVHEALETAVNLLLRETFIAQSFGRAEERVATLVQLEELNENLPTQSWRSREQVALQQFSTPPALAFVLACLLSPEPGKTALEPSAGTGSLAVWLQIAGCQTATNEICERRRQLLRLQGFEPFETDAEFLHDLLPDVVKPRFILMNPPFSTGGGRIARNDSNFGFRHVAAALERLNPGGRLIALLGAKSCLETDKGRNFWRRAAQEYEIHSFLKVPPKTFYKYGTTFPTVAVLVGKPENQAQKRLNPRNAPTFHFNSLSEMLLFAGEYDATDF